MIQVQEMQALFQSKMVVEHWNADLQTLHAISVAFQNRDLSQLTELIHSISFYKIEGSFINDQNEVFFQDPILQFHTSYLRNEGSKVQIIRKLSQMILDKKLQASLDQGKGLLILTPVRDTHVREMEGNDGQEIAENAVETIDMLNEVVDVLKTRADLYNVKLQELLSVCLTKTKKKENSYDTKKRIFASNEREA